jgi:LacI family transcriptional regulator
MIANSVIKLLRSNGKSVPDDISVSGFDNTPWSDLVTPSLTTMKQPIRGLGQEAVSMLMRRFEKPRSKKQNKFLEVDIIGRDSVAKL